MANIPKPDMEVLKAALTRPNLGTTINAGVQGFGTGVDLAGKMQAMQLAKKKQEDDLMAEIKALQMRQQAQDASLITPEMSSKVSKPVTPEVYRTLNPLIEPKEDKLPTGYQKQADGSIAPIKGSADDIKRQKEEAASKSLHDQNMLKAKMSRKFIEQTIPKVSNWTAGPGSKLQMIPGSAARNLQSDIQEIKSRIGLDALMAAKATSPTGASGFGQLSDKEMEILQAQVANLDTAQSPAQLREKLNTVMVHYDNVLALIEGRNPYGPGNPSPEGNTAPQGQPATQRQFKVIGKR